MRIKFFILLFIPLLHACSWVERFLIVNETAAPVTVELKLQKKFKGFNIFNYDHLQLYSGKSMMTDSLNNPVNAKQDTLEDFSHFKIIVPAKKTLCIGTLLNDHYKKHDQQFINDRVFNLEKIVIYVKGGKTEITVATFDDYFKKKKGDISYVVK